MFTFLSRYHIFMVQHTGADKVGKFYYFGVAIAPDSTRVEDILRMCMLAYRLTNACRKAQMPCPHFYRS